MVDGACGRTKCYRIASASKNVVQTQGHGRLLGEGDGNYARTGQSWEIVPFCLGLSGCRLIAEALMCSIREQLRLDESDGRVNVRDSVQK
jgi:hypothetical protein